MKEHLVIGSILAAVVVFFFLANIRATIIAALSIPASIIAAFAIINYMGFTLNSLTLLALTLSVGIVIDDAIVVMENIFRFIEEKDYTPYEAAIAATGEIGLAVLAITLSLVAVFLPIAMMEGIVGRFLKWFGITMAATILVSMLVSFTLTPMLAARWLSKKGGGGRGWGLGIRDWGWPRQVACPGGKRGSGSDSRSVAAAGETAPTTASKTTSGRSSNPESANPISPPAARKARSSTARSRASTWRCCGSRCGTRWVVVLGVIGCMATLPFFCPTCCRCASCPTTTRRSSR